MTNKHTKYCCSIASNPGTFGIEFHNQGYKELGLNFNYQALKVLPEQLQKTMELMRQNFVGCGVSMPHKMSVMKYVDSLSQDAREIGAVNTIVINNGSLRGENTDSYGAREAIIRNVDISKRDVVIVGTGGVARAIGYAVRGLGAKIAIVGRNTNNAIDLAGKLDAFAFPMDELPRLKGYMLINATPVGMSNPDESIIDQEFLGKFDAVMDVVVTRDKKTKLIMDAEKLGIKVISGLTMTTYQAAKQFEMYTGKTLPESFLNRFMDDWKNGRI